MNKWSFGHELALVATERGTWKTRCTQFGDSSRELVHCQHSRGPSNLWGLSPWLSLSRVQTCSNTHVHWLVTGTVPLHFLSFQIQSRGLSERACTPAQPPAASHSTPLHRGVAAGCRGASSLHRTHFPKPGGALSGETLSPSTSFSAKSKSMMDLSSEGEKLWLSCWRKIGHWC